MAVPLAMSAELSGLIGTVCLAVSLASTLPKPILSSKRIPVKSRVHLINKKTLPNYFQHPVRRRRWRYDHLLAMGGLVEAGQRRGHHVIEPTRVLAQQVRGSDRSTRWNAISTECVRFFVGGGDRPTFNHQHFKSVIDLERIGDEATTNP
jgi:hypothetical protein